MISRSQIQALSATVLATAASVGAIFVEPYISGATLPEKVMFVIFGTPALYGAFRVSEILLRRFYYRKILGEWFYVTVSGSRFSDENYASMKFDFDRNGMLTYDVQLYGSKEALLNYENPRGKAHSEALDYSAQKAELHILYNVNLLTDRLVRRGRLFLTLTRQNDLIGEWSSVFKEEIVSHGKMFATRPHEFATKEVSWRESIGATL